MFYDSIFIYTLFKLAFAVVTFTTLHIKLCRLVYELDMVKALKTYEYLWKNARENTFLYKTTYTWALTFSCLSDQKKGLFPFELLILCSWRFKKKIPLKLNTFNKIIITTYHINPYKTVHIIVMSVWLVFNGVKVLMGPLYRSYLLLSI